LNTLSEKEEEPDTEVSQRDKEREGMRVGMGGGHEGEQTLSSPRVKMYPHSSHSPPFHLQRERVLY